MRSRQQSEGAAHGAQDGTATRLGELVARGRTAELHAWGSDQVVKLFHPWMSIGAVKAERSRTAAALALGQPVPVPGEIVDVDGRTGIVLERICGQSMMELLSTGTADVVSVARQLAHMHAELHGAQPGPGFPVQADLLAGRIAANTDLPAAARDRALTALARLPRGDRLCHGDFHPGNIMLAPQGPVIIDWIDASLGDPLADVARSSLLFRGHIETNPVPETTRTAMEQFHDSYLERYFQLTGTERRRYLTWFPIVAAARLSERIPEQRQWLLSVVNEWSENG
jgi:aminoglycoside phosphotransferase (APT) family kinase protein